jgi:hypothetical protein
MHFADPMETAWPERRADQKKIGLKSGLYCQWAGRR